MGWLHIPNYTSLLFLCMIFRWIFCVPIDVTYYWAYFRINFTNMRNTKWTNRKVFVLLEQNSSFFHIYLNRLDVGVWHASNASCWFLTFIGKLVVDGDDDAEHSDATYRSILASSKALAIGNYLFDRTYQISAECTVDIKERRLNFWIFVIFICRVVRFL